MQAIEIEPNKCCRALIVDDSFLMRSTLKKILQHESRITDIDEAQDGKVAMDMIKSNDYDLILLDIEMPVMDGIEFMRRSKLHTDANIIVVSSLARVNSPQVEKVVQLGAFDVVAKPSGVLTLGMEDLKNEELLKIVSRSLAL